ncbi:UNVERIFIED_CONTAM: hypothetical protein GTU68_058914 [Idotea baltica]|nr:hypothetical protein [Idotea baltica]
MFCKKEIPFS